MSTAHLPLVQIEAKPASAPVADAACVHCGLCQPACPTYLQTGQEEESPRGRIQLMRALAEGRIQPTDGVLAHLDSCLDCRGCETACPSGVVYHKMLEETRAMLVAKGRGPLQRVHPLVRWFFLDVMVNPTRLKIALLPARILQKLGLYSFLQKSSLTNLLPAPMRRMMDLLPPSGPVWPTKLPERIGNKKGAISVGFLTGCVGSVLGTDINRKTVELLTASGANLYVPRKQKCCGAIHQHNGELAAAMDLARRNIDLFMPDGGPHVDFIVSNISGCGASLREYAWLLRDEPRYAQRAIEFCKRVRDINEMLLELELPAMMHPIQFTAAYHDACHLAHAQKVTEAPRQLLGRIPGLKLVPLAESDICCGAAGTYNLTQPKMAGELAQRKLRNFDDTRADICVASNIGCAMHLTASAKALGRPIRIVHPVELLHEAIFGPDRES